jgi:GTP-binding protein EngB required for normal cell division
VIGLTVCVLLGCTSSGKSTFVNALLGQSILPTAHSAATRIACEIKYGEKKQARIHSHCSGQSEVTWDLETKTQRKEFQSHVKGTVALKGSKGNGSSSCTCSKLEVFWPVDFLKDFTLVDSPGVTETEELVHSASCQITQDYLDGKICGFIFVLDSARSAEEASQAGGLLLPMPKDIFNRPAVESVLFVANKWDQIEEKVEEEFPEDKTDPTDDCTDHDPSEEHSDPDPAEEFLQVLKKGLRNRWKGFRSDHLVTLNSKLAGRLQDLGETTDDMKVLCGKIPTLVAGGMNNILRKALRRPYNLISQLVLVVESAVSQIRMPSTWKEDKTKKDTEALKSLMRVARGGVIDWTEATVHEQIEQLANALVVHLQERKTEQYVLKHVHALKEQKPKPQSLDLPHMVKMAFLKAICIFEGYKEACKLTGGQFRETIADFNVKRCDISGSDVPGAMQLLSKLQLSWYDENWAEAAMSQLQASDHVFSENNTTEFDEKVMAMYQQLVEKTSDRGCGLLQKVVTELLKSHSKGILDALIVQINELIEQVNFASDCKETAKYTLETLQGCCQDMTSRLADFQLKLKMHTFTECDITEEEEGKQVLGRYGTVSKVSLGEVMKTAALKKFNEPIGNRNARELMNELLICSLCALESPRHVVVFLGSVIMASRDNGSSLKLGLCFEWCAGGTLATCIADQEWRKTSVDERYPEFRQMMHEMLNGLDFLHSSCIIHRDLNPENISLTLDRKVRISDMGLAKEKGTATTPDGTLAYMAPEVVDSLPHSTSADLYSVGVILLEVWNAKRLKEIIPDLEEVQGKELRQRLVMDAKFDPGKVDTEWAALAKDCWEEKPWKRPKAKELSNKLLKLSK